VTAVKAVGRSLRCPGPGSSISSTIPRALLSEGCALESLIAAAFAKVRGDGGGLRDCDLRASSCRNGIGENSGVEGADCRVEPNTVAPRPKESFSSSVRGGKLSHSEVTSIDFSTARRYFPTEL
jgi:hypothetical protein